MTGKRTIAGLLLAVAVASTIPAHGSQASLLQQSTNAFNTAQQADKLLNSKPQFEQSRADVLKVINSYQRVYLITPKTSYADDALLAIARLYESINDNRNAIKTLKFLAHEYPQSPFRKSAERDIAALSETDEAVPQTPATSADASVDVKEVKTVEVARESKPPKETNGTARTDAKPGEKVTVDNIRYWPAEKSLRVVVDLSGEVRFKQGEARSPDRVYIDIANAHLNSSLVSKEWPVESGLLQKIRVGQYDAGTVRVVLDVGTMLRATSFTLKDPDRLIIDVVGETDAAVPATVEPAPKRIITEVVPVSPPHPPTVNSAPAPAVASVSASATKSNGKPASETKPEIKSPPLPAAVTSAPSPAVAAASVSASATKSSGKPASEAKPEIMPPPRPVAAAPTPTPVVAVASVPSSETKPETKSPPEAKPENSPALDSKTEIKAMPEVKPENKPVDLSPQMASTAKPTSLGNRTLIRSLGLKVSRVVIDAGHGGKDTGSIGPTGYSEKDLVLDVAKRLKTLIETEIGAEVVMTRSDDTFVPLETRTAIANQQEADLFISIHANSSKTRTVRGVETFFLNFTNSREALDTASRENAGSDKSVHELSDLVKRIVLSEKVTESRELAERVQAALSKAKGTGPDRGVKQAPFVVLIGATMPSILAEVSFISNPDEEKVLRTPGYRQHIAESLLDGVRSYADTLSGIKTASSIEKD